MLTTKEMLFFLLILILMIVSTKGVITFTPKNIDQDLMSVIGATVVTIILLVIYKTISVCESSDSFSLSNGFSVTPEILCDGGEYLRTSAPKEIQDMCSKRCKKGCRCDRCSRGFNGKSINFEYTPMSDDNWQNQMCNGM